MNRLAPRLLANGRVARTLPISAPVFLIACQPATPRSRASVEASAACRAEVDRVYAAQNRVDLSTRDGRDTPFSSGYLAGNTTRGLGAEYGRDGQYQTCLSNAAAPGPAPAAAGTPPANIGPAFSPAAR